MKVNQKTATCNALLSVLADRGVEYELNGETPIKSVLTADDKSKARDILFAMFKEGQITYKPEFEAKVNDDSALKSYINGLVNNWIRKNKEFNGGVVYKPKNPGSRAGSTDSKVKEMRKLLSVTTDPEAKTAIQNAINARLAEISAEKNKVEIDYDKINPELLAQLGIKPQA